MGLPQALQRAAAADATLALKLAAEACLSERTVARCLAGVGVRSNTVIGIVRAWERLRRAAIPRESRLMDAGAAAAQPSRLEDSRPASRLEDTPKRKKRPQPKKGSRLAKK